VPFHAVPAILDTQMPLQFQPMPLLKRAAPFDDPEWVYELKYDGFRALAIIENGHAQLISRNGHPFASFAERTASPETPVNSQL
jgi:ATP-dependent DNA ligase